MTRKTLDGQVALVTGASVHLGRVIAQALAERGVAVAVHYSTFAADTLRLVAAIRREGGVGQAFHTDLRKDAEQGVTPVRERK